MTLRFCARPVRSKAQVGSLREHPFATLRSIKTSPFRRFTDTISDLKTVISQDKSTYMKTTILFAATCFLAIGMTSCKKDSSVNKSNVELLSQKAWVYEAQGLDENNNGVIDGSESDMLSCQSDDSFTFYSNGSGVYSSGSVKCGPDDVNANFNWEFLNNGTELAIFAYPEKVNKLDEHTLETYVEGQNSQGETVKYIRRFHH